MSRIMAAKRSLWRHEKRGVTGDMHSIALLYKSHIVASAESPCPKSVVFPAWLTELEPLSFLYGGRNNYLD